MFKRVFGFLVVFSLFAGTVLSQSGLDYPKPRRDSQVDEFHGVKVADPYRWMEDTDSSETRSWIDAENRLTNSYLAGIPQRDAIRKRLTELYNYERFSVPVRHGDYYIYSRNDGLQNQSVLYRAEKLTDPGTVFFDPNKLRADGTAALSGSAFSDDGKLWAYGVAEAGSDRTEWHVMDVASGKLLPDTLAPNRNYGISWLKDNSGFFYISYAAVEKGSELKENTFFQKLYFHKLGTPQSEDPVIYERPDNKEYFVVRRGLRGWPLAHHHRRKRHRVDEYGVLQGSDERKSKIRPIVTNLANSYSFLGNDGGVFYFQTDWKRR